MRTDVCVATEARLREATTLTAGASTSVRSGAGLTLVSVGAPTATSLTPIASRPCLVMRSAMGPASEVHMSTQSEAKKAKLEKPANYYKSPDDITKDADLSPDEKRQALNTWEQDARQMLTASNEGMEGDEEGLDQRDTHRLGEVVRAKG